MDPRAHHTPSLTEEFLGEPSRERRAQCSGGVARGWSSNPRWPFSWWEGTRETACRETAQGLPSTVVWRPALLHGRRGATWWRSVRLPPRRSWRWALSSCLRRASILRGYFQRIFWDQPMPAAGQATSSPQVPSWIRSTVSQLYPGRQEAAGLALGFLCLSAV